MSLQPGGPQSVYAGATPGALAPSAFGGIEALLAFARAQAGTSAPAPKKTLATRAKAAIDKQKAAKAADQALLTNAPIMTPYTQAAMYASANQAAARARGEAGGGY